MLQLAGQQGLDNLTFVVNCNLQRLDGPVRGNGKIIQELEAQFRGAGWNVIKVIWGREWDALLNADKDRALVNLMNTTPDGDFQTYRAENGAFIREHFFGRDPRTKQLVEKMTDDEIWALKRGGHDYRKIYAAYKAAREHTGQPTVILAHTIKGYGLGSGFAGRNATHQMKKLKSRRPQDAARLAAHPDHGRADRREPVRPAVLPPGHRRRGHPVHARAPPPARRLRARAPHDAQAADAAGRQGLRAAWPRARGTRRSPRRWRSCACSRTWCGTRSSATAWCRSSPTRPARSAWTRSSRAPRSSTRTARTTWPWTASSCSPTRSPSPARSCTRASTRPVPRRRSRPSARRTRRTASR